MYFYLIRHKATKEYMPQMVQSRGYTYWNPNIKASRPKPINNNVMPIPRLFAKLHHAKQAANYWATMPNAHYRYSYKETKELCCTTDGRVIDDIEIVRISIYIDKIVPVRKT